MTAGCFHLGDVLSVTSDRLVSPRGMEGFVDILEFLTGVPLWTHQLPRAGEICKPWLLKCFPQFVCDNGEDLDERLQCQGDNDKIVGIWLMEKVGKYGAQFQVFPLPRGVYKSKHSVDELLEVIPAKKVMVVLAED